MKKNNYNIKKVFNGYVIFTTLASITATMGMTVDTVVIGNVLGSEAVAAAGVVIPMFLAMIALGGVFGNGAGACCMQYLGAGEKKKCDDLFLRTALMSIVVGIIVMILVIIFREKIAIILGAKEGIIDMSADYIVGLALGSIAIIINQLLLQITRIDGNPKLSLYSIVVMTAINVFLDFFFELVCSMGMFGMALATSISYIAGDMVCFMHFRSKKNTVHFKFFRNRDKGSLRKMLFTGVPGAMTRVCTIIRTAVINNIITIVGLTAMSIQSNISNLSAAIFIGVGQTLALLSGFFYGEKDATSLKQSVRYSLKVGIIASLVITFIFILFTPFIISMFGITEGEAVVVSTKAAIFYAISIPAQMITYIYINYYESTENVGVSNIIIIISELVLPLAFVKLLWPLFKENSVWSCILAAQILTVLLLPITIHFSKKKDIKNLDDTFLIPESFYKNKVFEISIKRESSELREANNKIREFCLENSVCEEEKIFVEKYMNFIINDVKESGYSDNKKHYIDLKLEVSKEKISIRVLDDGKKTNIDKLDNLDYHIEYRNVLGLNNTSLVFDRR